MRQDFVKHSLRFKSQLMDLDSPRVMGILNCTPDSFHDGGAHGATEGLIAHGRNLWTQGADILDIGGASTRPGAEPVSPDDEWQRIQPVIEGLLAVIPQVIISVDTFHASVAARALEAGAHMINDVTGGDGDPEMWPVVASAQVPYVLMHMQGTPQTMQQSPNYLKGVVPEVYQSLLHRVAEARAAGIGDVVADVGFGFGKTLVQNFQLLDNLDAFALLDVPLLIGISRKSMIHRALNISPAEALNGTTALHAWALERGAHILRVHDTKEAVETIKLHRLLETARASSRPVHHR